MNIKQLKELIKDLPDHMDVFVAERKTEFTYGAANTGYVKEINFTEEPGGEVLARDKVFIIDEE